MSESQLEDGKNFAVELRHLQVQEIERGDEPDPERGKTGLAKRMMKVPVWKFCIPWQMLCDRSQVTQLRC